MYQIIENICRGISHITDEGLSWAYDLRYKKENGFEYDELEFLPDSIIKYVLPRLIKVRQIKKNDTFKQQIGELANGQKITYKQWMKDTKLIIAGFKEHEKYNNGQMTGIDGNKIKVAQELFSKLGTTF